MSDKNAIYKMKLHDELELHNSLHILRVPGGWIYRNDCENGTGGWSMTSVFVPFNGEVLE